MCVVFILRPVGIIAAVGVSNLQYVDLNSSRNMCIFGFALFFGLSFPKWIEEHGSLINTGLVTVFTAFATSFTADIIAAEANVFPMRHSVGNSDVTRPTLLST